MDNLPYFVNYEDSAESGTLTFSGQLIINFIESLTTVVKERINTKKDLVIAIDNPESMDVTFIQLLLAIKASYKESGKSIRITANLKDELSRLIENAGFTYVLK